MNPEMRIESISFDGEGPYLQMVVSMDRSEDVPATWRGWNIPGFSGR